MLKLLAQGVDLNKLPLGNGTNISTNYKDAASLVSVILRNSLTLATILATCFLIYGGVSFIISAGNEDPKEVQKAKTTVTEAVIGLLIIFSTFFILQIVQTITGAKIL